MKSSAAVIQPVNPSDVVVVEAAASWDWGGFMGCRQQGNPRKALSHQH